MFEWLKHFIIGFFMTSVTLIKGDTFQSGEVDYRDALPVNMYGVIHQVLGAAGYMYQLAGLTEFAIGQGIDRGGVWCSAEGFEGHYRVSGSSFIVIDELGNSTILGSVGGSEQCPMTFSFNNVILVADKKLYYYNPTDGFRQIESKTGSIVGDPIDCLFIANFIMLTDGTRIYHSQISTDLTPENEELFPFENEAVAEFEPDVTYGIEKNEDNELVVFGQFSTEHFIFNGAEFGFAFTPLDRKASKLGVSGTKSMDELEGVWYTVGRREESAPSCYIYVGGSGQRIASREIEQVLKKYTDNELSTTTVDCMTIDKINLVFYHFPNETYLFNQTLSESLGADSAWSIVKTGVQADNYRARNFVRDPRIGKWLVGDKSNTNIGIFDENIATQYEEIAEWILFTPFLKLESMSIDKIEIETIPGIVNDIEDATVFVSRTDDGRTNGKEWSKLYGDQWDYTERFYIRRFGYVRNWVGLKFRGASRNRMAFGLLNVEAS